MLNSSLKSTLENFVEKNTVVSIFATINDNERICTGFIVKVSKNYVLINHISKHGFYDGYIVCKIADIFQIDYNGLYEKRISKLYYLHNQKHERLLSVVKSVDDNILKDVLAQAKEREYIVSLLFSNSENNEDGISGWVKEMHDDTLIISKVSYYGGDDGDSVIRYDNIIIVDCDTDDEMSLKLLNMSTHEQNAK